MKIDFHFYLVYALAERCGFNQDLGNGVKEARMIAYASQYVDDNNESQVIGTTEEERPEMVGAEPEAAANLIQEINRYQKFPWAVRIRETRNFFRPIMTQTISFNSLLPMFQRYLFVPFHFLPGDPEKVPVIKGRKNPWSTTPNSRNSVKILKDALDSGDLYRIGVALHTFADTWSHQNFSGLQDDWNAARGSFLIPDVGHAEVLEKPDIISEKWKDKRLNLEIANVDRARAAVKETFTWLSEYRNPGLTWEDVKDEFEELLKAEDMDERIEMVKAMSPGEDLGYEETLETRWIYQALEYDSNAGEVIGKPGFLNSHWYRFQLAVQKHLANVFLFFPKEV